MDTEDNPILDDEEVLEGLREIMSLGYSPQDIFEGAKYVELNTDWIDEEDE